MNNLDLCDGSVFRCLRSATPTQPSRQAQTLLEANCKDSIDFVQRLGKVGSLKAHDGCVNSVRWHQSGAFILSASDDKAVVISNPFSGQILQRVPTRHTGNIFSARFLPPESSSAGHEAVSCCGYGIIVHTNFERNESTTLGRHQGMYAAYDILPLPDAARCVLSCGEDRTVRLYDLRQRSLSQEEELNGVTLIKTPKAATSIDVPYCQPNCIVVGCADSVVRLYDRRFLRRNADESHHQSVKCFPYPLVKERPYRITSVKCSRDNACLLVNYSGGSIYMYDIGQPGLSESELVSTGYFAHQKPMYDKSDVIQLRGDWSDTGPISLELPAADQYANERRSGSLNIASRFHIARTIQFLRGIRRLNGEMAVQSESAAIAPATNETIENALESSTRRSAQLEANDQHATTGAYVPVADSRQNQLAEEQLVPPLAPSLVERLNEYAIARYTGHRNIRTTIKDACFWGRKFIISGSDCGHIFIWERATGRLIKTLEADNHVVNRVAVHPHLPYVASSGIDYDYKIWAPIEPTPTFDEDAATTLVKRNEAALARSSGVVAMNPVSVLRSMRLYLRRQVNEIVAEAD